MRRKWTLTKGNIPCHATVSPEPTPRVRIYWRQEEEIFWGVKKKKKREKYVQGGKGQRETARNDCCNYGYI